MITISAETTKTKNKTELKRDSCLGLYNNTLPPSLLSPIYTTTKNVYYQKKKKNRCNNIEVIVIVYEKCCNKI